MDKIGKWEKIENQDKIENWTKKKIGKKLKIENWEKIENWDKNQKLGQKLKMLTNGEGRKIKQICRSAMRCSRLITPKCVKLCTIEKTRARL